MHPAEYISTQVVSMEAPMWDFAVLGVALGLIVSSIGPARMGVKRTDGQDLHRISM